MNMNKVRRRPLRIKRFQILEEFHQDPVRAIVEFSDKKVYEWSWTDEGHSFTCTKENHPYTFKNNRRAFLVEDYVYNLGKERYAPETTQESS